MIRFYGKAIQFAGEVKEGGNHIVRQVGIDDLPAVDHNFFQHGRSQAKNYVAVILEPGQPRIDDPPGV